MKNNELEIIKAIRYCLTDSLRKPKYRGHPNRFKGHCYVASEAAYHLLGGKEAGYKPMQIKHEGDSHWFLRHENRIIDITQDQFETRPKWHLARGKGFLTHNPSMRAWVLMHLVKQKLDGKEGRVAEWLKAAGC